MNTYDKDALQHEPPEHDSEPERPSCEHDWITLKAPTAADGTQFMCRKCGECDKVEWSEL